jgi:peptidoglycan hydrolase-like protein with peptidoglycan-binding domain
MPLNKPVLQLNASGETVKELQTLLRDYSAKIGARSINPGTIDGEFGAGTEQAVMAFQEQVFLPRTGVAGDMTWRSLFKGAPVDLPDLKFGETSDSVKILEERLVRLKLLAGTADRKYEQRTLDAVQSFQKTAKLPKRSTVDDAFWFALSKVPVV